MESTLQYYCTADVLLQSTQESITAQHSTQAEERMTWYVFVTLLKRAPLAWGDFACDNINNNGNKCRHK